MVLISSQMWSPEPENCQNRNPHISKIGKQLQVCPTNNRRRSDHISEPRAKFDENRWRIVDVIPNRIQILNLHISKNPISISGFIHHWIQSRHCWILSICAIWCWSVEKCGHHSLKTAKMGISTLRISSLVAALICRMFNEERSGCGMLRCCVQNLRLYLLTYLLTLYLLTHLLTYSTYFYLLYLHCLLTLLT